MEDITDANCKYGKRVQDDFKIQNLVPYHDLYVQSDTLLLSDVLFESLQSKCIKIYGFDPAFFLSAVGLG